MSCASFSKNGSFKKLKIEFSLYLMHKKRSFQLKISAVNVIKFSGNCIFGKIY